MSEEVQVMTGKNRYVTLYTPEKINALVAGIQPLSGSSLPTASATYRGKFFTLLGGTGTADACYVCLKNANGSYSWQDIITFRFGPG